MSEIYEVYTYIVHYEYSVGQLFCVISLEFSDTPLFTNDPTCQKFKNMDDWNIL